MRRWGAVVLVLAVLSAPECAAAACDGDDAISLDEIHDCVRSVLGEVPPCPACDLGGDGGVDILELQAAVGCLAQSGGAPCVRDTLYDGVCGNGEREGSEGCDDGNGHGGDGCAANCTVESDLVLNLGDQTASQSGALLQTIGFRLELPITGSQVFTIGQPRRQAVRGIGGATFEPGALPFVGVVEKNRGRIDPIVVPGLVCACQRNVALQTCGGRPPTPADAATVCTLDVFENIDPSVCPPEDPCKPTFGPGVSLAGAMGCKGARRLDYAIGADSTSPATTYARSGGRVPFGGTATAFTALGLILDGGTCSFDATDPDKGADGLPCTDDDALETLGMPEVLPLTTGTASGTVLNANGEIGKHIADGNDCGMLPCLTSASGQARSCEDLVAGRAGGVCMAGAFARLAQPAAGAAVVPVRYCALP